MINDTFIDLALQEDNMEELKELFQNYSEYDLADLISERPPEEQIKLFQVIPKELQPETFSYLPFNVQNLLIKTLPSDKAARILKHLTPDDRTAFLEELPKQTIDELVKLLPYDERVLTLTLLGYPEGSVGRLMTPDYLAVKMNWTVDEVLTYIKDYGHDSETIDVIYVVDDEGKLIDDLRIKEFLLSARDKKVSDLTDGLFIDLSVNDTDESAINLFQQYNRVALPVTDEKGELLGIVTFDDILRLSNEETTEDFQKMGGTEALDQPYMQVAFFDLLGKRAGWLVILFIGELFTATAMSFFEGEIEKAVVLALFLPLIISSGGNSGSQACTLVIRAMALGEVELKDWWRIARKELMMGLFLGVILGSIGFFRITFGTAFTDIYGEHWFLLAVTIFFSLIGVVLMGTLTGALMPLIMRACRFDPATSSAPFIATIVDVVGLVIYFLIAILILTGTLL
jgi:magnesium transporter